MAELAVSLLARTKQPQEEAARALQLVDTRQGHWLGGVDPQSALTQSAAYGGADMVVISGVTGVVSVVELKSSLGLSNQVTSYLENFAADTIQVHVVGMAGANQTLTGSNFTLFGSQLGFSNVVTLTMSGGNAQQAGSREAPNIAVGGTEFRGRVAGPVMAILKVLDRWRIDNELAAKVLGATEPGYIADLHTGVAGLRTRDAQDRARLVLDIYEGVHSLVRDAAAECEWIRVLRDELDRKSVLDLMTEGSQLSLLRAKAFVDYVNGR